MSQTQSHDDCIERFIQLTSVLNSLVNPNNLPESVVNCIPHDPIFMAFIESMKVSLPVIHIPPCLVFEEGGYIHSNTGRIADNVPPIAQAVDQYGRSLFFIKNDFIFQRYYDGSSLRFL